MLPAATQQGEVPAAVASGERERDAGRGARTAAGEGVVECVAAAVGEGKAEGDGEVKARLAALEDELVRRQEDLRAALANVEQVWCGSQRGVSCGHNVGETMSGGGWWKRGAGS